MSEERLLDGERCIITGGSRGLGRALGEAFARAGARVCFTYSTDDGDADEARAAIAAAGGEPPLVCKGSVADAAHARDVVRQVVGAWGGVDVLVNNAGLMQVLPLALLEEEDWDLVLDVNLKGAFLFSRAAARHMIKARKGHILNIGNFASERIVESPLHYAAAKAGLRGLTEALAKEVGRYGVGVNLLSPGILDVGMGRALPQHRVQEYLDQCPLGRLGTVEELAEFATFVVSPRNRFMTGAKLVLDGGL